ncbi:MAG TPA: alpha/beta hydrolase [Frankiaceae bacterium]|nr:alpha/beta hydrolase [Frankiaceae bacterium]
MFLPRADGSRFALHDLGGDGPPVLICHATGFCGRAYEPLAQALGDRFHVWALDMPGHGDSDDPPGGDFAWREMVGDVAAATRAISSRPLACVVGHSMGGAVALQAAADDPTLFAAAYLFEPIVSEPVDVARRTGNNPMADGARRRQGTFASKPEALWRYARRRPMQELSAGSLAAYVEHGFRDNADGTVSLKCSPESEARTFESSVAITTATITAASLPTLVVTGATSALAAMGQPVVEALRHAELRSHRHLGHFGPLQGPEVIADEIAAHAQS